MLTTTLLPDGRVAIYEHGVYLGRARNQEHADEWCARRAARGRTLGDIAWELAEAIWSHMTPEQQRRFMDEPKREAA